MFSLNGKGVFPTVVLNFLHSLLAAALAVMLPIYLLEKKIDIADIGLIFAVLPFFMLFMRLFFASIADGIGTRNIFQLNGLFGMLQIAAYWAAGTAPAFALGKMFESLETSAFWAVNRTGILDIDKKTDPGKAVSRFTSLRGAAEFLGMTLVGVGITYFGFNSAFIALFALSMIMSAAAFMIGTKNKEGLDVRKTFARIMRKKDGAFWRIGCILMLLAIAQSVLGAFLFPLYVYTQLSFSAAEVGLLLALVSGFYGIGVFIMLKQKVSYTQLAKLTVILGSLPLLAYGWAPKEMIWVLTIIYAVGTACGSILYEKIITINASSRQTMSTDIGLLHVPLRILETAAFALAGFAVLALGYQTLFIMSAVSITLFAVYSRRLIK